MLVVRAARYYLHPNLKDVELFVLQKDETKAVVFWVLKRDREKVLATEIIPLAKLEKFEESDGGVV